MDDLGNILYIVIVIAYLLYSYLGGGSKKATPPPQGQGQEAGGRTIADMLEEYLEEVAPEENQPRPQSVPSPPAQSQGGRSGRYKRKLAQQQATQRKKHHEAVSMESGKRIETLMPEYDFSSEGGSIKTQSLINFAKGEISDVGIYDSIDGLSSLEENKSSNFVFNGRDMIIYDTIMNKKY